MRFQTKLTGATRHFTFGSSKSFRNSVLGNVVNFAVSSCVFESRFLWDHLLISKLLFFVIIECTTEDGMSCKIHPPKAWTFMNLCSLLILCANLESFRFPKGTTGISYKPLRLIWMLITQIIFSVEQCVHHVSVNAFLLMLNFLLIFVVMFLVSCIVPVVNC